MNFNLCISYQFFIYVLFCTSFWFLKCNHHNYLRIDEELPGVEIRQRRYLTDRSKRFLDDSQQSMRVRLMFDDSVYRLDREKFDLIEKVVLPKAVTYWEQSLSVRRVESSIKLNRKCVNNHVFYKQGERLPYCRSACESVTMCGEVPVPPDHLQPCRVCNTFGRDCHVIQSNASAISPADSDVAEGVSDTDFILYISAVETARCSRDLTVAYAAHCQQEVEFDRPIAGHANLCPSSISLKSQELHTLISTVKHEILHALGFSVSLYAFYRDSEGLPLTARDQYGRPPLNNVLQVRQWSNRVIRTFYRHDWLTIAGNITRQVDMVVTPRVVNEVRKHFGCDILEGAELEDQGDDGTALTHWEKRVFENEAMTGTHTQNPVYSRITLALMEDTGWYRVNYSMAQPLIWGRGLGCQFVLNSCYQWIATHRARADSIYPFCDSIKTDPLHTECTQDLTSVALCNLFKYALPLSSRYQNFEHLPHVSPGQVARYGGSVILADYCPYMQEFTWRSNNTVVRSSHCSFHENNPTSDRNFALESYSPTSRCFLHSRRWEEKKCFSIRQWQHWGSGCYKYSCSNNRLYIVVGKYSYMCLYEGQKINISLLANSWLHIGGLVCPKCSALCNECEVGEMEMIYGKLNMHISNIYHVDKLDSCYYSQISSTHRLAASYSVVYLLYICVAPFIWTSFLADVNSFM